MSLVRCESVISDEQAGGLSVSTNAEINQQETDRGQQTRKKLFYRWQKPQDGIEIKEHVYKEEKKTRYFINNEFCFGRNEI